MSVSGLISHESFAHKNYSEILYFGPPPEQIVRIYKTRKLDERTDPDLSLEIVSA